MREWSDDQLRHQSNELRKRIKIRCQDLMDVVTTPDKETSWILRSSVDFIHRSVYDYLRLEQTFQMLRGRVTANYNADEELCKAHVGQLHMMPSSSFMGKTLSYDTNIIVKHILLYSRKVEEIADSTVIVLLDKTEAILWVLGSRSIGALDFEDMIANAVHIDIEPQLGSGQVVVPHNTYNNMKPLLRSGPESPVLLCAILEGLCGYVSYRFTKHRSAIHNVGGCAPLYVALIWCIRAGLAGHRGSEIALVRMISLLLGLGAGPNQSIGKGIVWECFLNAALGRFKEVHEVFLPLLSLMLEHKASPISKLDTKLSASTRKSWMLKGSEWVPKFEALFAQYEPHMQYKPSGSIWSSKLSFPGRIKRVLWTTE